jgi:hypothetical protein
METEVFRINKELLDELRENVAYKYKGRNYGQIGSTIERAIREYLDREKLHQEFKDKMPVDAFHELEMELIYLREKLSQIHKISLQEE